MRQTRRVPTTSDFERMLRGVALPVTRPRVAVLSAVHDRPHADTESIIGAVRGQRGEDGSTIDEAEVVHLGVCPACSTARRS